MSTDNLSAALRSLAMAIQEARAMPQAAAIIADLNNASAFVSVAMNAGVAVHGVAAHGAAAHGVAAHRKRRHILGAIASDGLTSALNIIGKVIQRVRVMPRSRSLVNHLNDASSYISADMGLRQNVAAHGAAAHGVAAHGVAAPRSSLMMTHVPRPVNVLGEDSFCGFDCLGAEDIGAVTIPTVGADYTDAKTVTAVQYALVKKGYNIGDTGPTKDGVDGVLGPKTKAAIKKVQAIANADVNGRIDETVIMALGVTPGVLPPGVTAAGRAAVQAQVALDAATAAEHAVTPSDVQIAAQAAVDVAPASPPELKQAAQKALVKAKAATTPAQVQAAAQDVKAAAQDVHSAVKPSWWTSPAWAGGWPRWQVSAVAGGGIVALGTLLAVLASSGTPAAVVAAVTGPMRALKRRGVGR